MAAAIFGMWAGTRAVVRDFAFWKSCFLKESITCQQKNGSMFKKKKKD